MFGHTSFTESKRKEGVHLETAPVIPPYHEMMWPTILALRALGDSGSIQEINDTAAELAGYTDEQLAVLHNEGPRSEVHYRMAWARSHLKNAGGVNNSSRGVWSLTDYGSEITESMIPELHSKARQVGQQRRKGEPERQRCNKASK